MPRISSRVQSWRNAVLAVETPALFCDKSAPPGRLSLPGLLHRDKPSLRHAARKNILTHIWSEYRPRASHPSFGSRPSTIDWVSSERISSKFSGRGENSAGRQKGTAVNFSGPTNSELIYKLAFSLRFVFLDPVEGAGTEDSLAVEFFFWQEIAHHRP